jgi:hypothetical protein
MWIKCQSKFGKTIVNTNAIKTLFTKETIIGMERYTTIGKYSTEERATEIYNQIKGLLTRVDNHHMFEMPEE